MSASALYEGWVRHRRLEPVRHEFRQRLFMAYLDLDELPEVLDRVPLWSARRPAPAWFRARDYLDVEHDGPVRVLTHVRTFGHRFNPVSLPGLNQSSQQCVRDVNLRIAADGCAWVDRSGSAWGGAAVVAEARPEGGPQRR